MGSSRCILFVDDIGLVEQTRVNINFKLELQKDIYQNPTFQVNHDNVHSISNFGWSRDEKWAVEKIKGQTIPNCNNFCEM